MKTFTQKKYRDLASTAHANVMFSMGLQDPEIMKAGLNAYNKAMRILQADLLDICAKYVAKTYNIATAMARFKEVLGVRYQELFRAGAMSTGNFFYDELGLTRKDRAFIASARREEMEYLGKFLIDIRNSDPSPVNPYEDKIKYYGKSGKSMFFNGQLAGFGTDVEIYWVLGTPQTKHCPDCINMSRRIWTWETLPTVPMAGDTRCLFMCTCSLSFRHKGSLNQVEIGGEATSTKLDAPVRYAYVYDSAGNELGGQIQKLVEDISARMNKARQMIELTSGEEMIRWINIRKALNQELIDIQTSRKLLSLPAISMADLESTIKATAEKGGMLIDDFVDLVDGDEVYFVRSDFAAVGIILIENNRLSFRSRSNITVVIDDRTDIIFSLGKRVRN